MDTIEGGKWLPDQELAWTLVTKAIERVARARERDRLLLRPQSGRHAARQGLCRPDLRSHRAQGRSHRHRDHQPADGAGVGAAGIRRLEEHRAVALVPVEGRRVDRRRAAGRHPHRRLPLRRGAGRAARHRRRPDHVSLSHALRATRAWMASPWRCALGLPLRDMEMVQFHPTGLLAGPDTRMTGTVLEEGLRGAGGHLLNGAMHRFMGDYDPTARARHPRRGQPRHLRRDEGRPHHAARRRLHQDEPSRARERSRKQFKGMVDRCRDCGFDLAGGLVEVVPTAHYFMGGVVCRADTSTELPGLFVAGEDASGMHGANRLGGNGVANSTVFGGIAGDTMPRWIRRESPATARPMRTVIEAEIARALRSVRAQAGRSQPAARKAARYHVGRRRRHARPRRARSRARGARRHRGGASCDRPADDDRAFN